MSRWNAYTHCHKFFAPGSRLYGPQGHHLATISSPRGRLATPSWPTSLRWRPQISQNRILRGNLSLSDSDRLRFLLRFDPPPARPKPCFESWIPSGIRHRGSKYLLRIRFPVVRCLQRMLSGHEGVAIRPQGEDLAADWKPCGPYKWQQRGEHREPRTKRR